MLLTDDGRLQSRITEPRYKTRKTYLAQVEGIATEEALDKLQRNPLLYRQIHKDLRRVPIRRFPHRIFYLVNGNRVIVTAVFHARKDPTSWTERA